MPILAAQYPANVVGNRNRGLLFQINQLLTKNLAKGVTAKSAIYFLSTLNWENVCRLLIDSLILR